MIDEALATQFHETAMAYAHRAAVASDVDESERLYRLALEHERRAADLLEQEKAEEPTRSILYRSAATLALDCREYDEAERLIDKGLAGSPSVDMAAELRELRQKVSLERKAQIDLSDSSASANFPGQSTGGPSQRGTGSYRIFLSHSAGDSYVARSLAERIQRYGGEVWLDANDLSGGDSIYSRILEAVDACDEAVMILSPHSLYSKSVLLEIGAFWGQHKRITPVLVHVSPEALQIIPGIKTIMVNEFEQLFLPELANRISGKASASLVG